MEACKKKTRPYEENHVRYSLAPSGHAFTGVRPADGRWCENRRSVPARVSASNRRGEAAGSEYADQQKTDLRRLRPYKKIAAIFLPPMGETFLCVHPAQGHLSRM